MPFSVSKILTNPSILFVDSGNIFSREEPEVTMEEEREGGEKNNNKKEDSYIDEVTDICRYFCRQNFKCLFRFRKFLPIRRSFSSNIFSREERWTGSNGAEEWKGKRKIRGDIFVRTVFHISTIGV